MGTIAIDPSQPAPIAGHGPIAVEGGSPGACEAIYANFIAQALNEFGRWSPGRGVALVGVPIRPGGRGRELGRPGAIFARDWPWATLPGLARQADRPILPDLAVAVVGRDVPTSTIEGRIVAYLAAGVRQVWVVHPATCWVYVHESLGSVRVVARDGKLYGGAILPGFELAMLDLFPGDEPATAGTNPA